MTSFRFSRMALLGSAAVAAVAGTAVQAQDTQLDGTSAGYRYDGAGRLVGVINPDPDGAGPLLFSATRTYYDSAGLIVRVESGELSGWQPNSVAPSNWPGFRILKTERFYYDTLNQRVKAEVVGSDGITVSVTQTNYDRDGREGCSAMRMNPAAFATTPASACDQGTVGSNGKDRITRKFYDGAGRLTQIRAGVGTSIEEPYATYGYTPNGKQQTVIDANGNRALFEYDSLDRLRRWYFPSAARAVSFDGSSANAALNTAGAYNAADYEEYGYDANGSRTSLRKRDGQTITYGFDNLNQVSHKGGASVVAVDYTYDLRGLQLSANFTIGGEGVQATYDGFGRVQTNTSTMGGGSRTLGYGYDNNGNRTRVTHPDGNFVTYNYDKLNRPDCILRSATGECTAAPAGTMLVDYAYNDRGLPIAMNGAITTGFGYDNAGRLTSLSNNLAASAWNNSWAFAYNPAAQIISNDRSNDAFAWTASVNADRPYVTNGLNQYTAAGAASFCYDANGNLTADGASVYRYDAENRLTERRLQGANNANCAALAYTGELKASLRYDPLGRLFQVTSGSGAVTRFLNDGDEMVAEYDGANNLLNRYVHGSDAKRDDPIVWYNGAGFTQANERHLRTDWQGSIVLVTDATGSTVNVVNRYDEFGIPNCPIIGGLPDCTQPGANQGRFQYTGQAWIAELGMYYYKARIYSPTLGRFLQTDPVGYEDQMDLYAYASNDPINNVDFDGQESGQVAYDSSVSLAQAAEEQRQRVVASRAASLRIQTTPTTRWAANEIGRGHYSYPSNASDARGSWQDRFGAVGHRGFGALKCNQFVFDALSAGGHPPVRMADGRIPSASEWGNSKSKIGGYHVVTGTPRPGDVLADHGHVGIVGTMPNGNLGTISAASPVASPLIGEVVHNNWGFRPGQDLTRTLWRAN